MKVALTVWENRISPLLDTARTLLIAEIEEGRLVSTWEKKLSGDNVQDLLLLLESSGAEALICGAVSRRFATWLSSSGLKLFPFISGEADAVLDAFLKNRLSDPVFAMPGCGRGGMGRGGGVGRCGSGPGGGRGGMGRGGMGGGGMGRGGMGRGGMGGGGMGRGAGRQASCFQQPDFPEPCPDCDEKLNEE